MAKEAKLKVVANSTLVVKVNDQKVEVAPGTPVDLEKSEAERLIELKRAKLFQAKKAESEQDAS